MHRIITLNLSPDEVKKLLNENWDKCLEYLKTEFGIDPARVKSVNTVQDIGDAKPLVMVHIKVVHNLQDELNIAIEEEDYERAAELRNKINMEKNK